MEQSGEVDVAELIEPGGQTDVAVVEADHGEAVAGEKLTKPVRPREKLLANSHDQQHRRITGISEPLVMDFDTVRLDKRHVGPLLT
ncbi:hypothetical protein GCM10023214_60320 [Amycolatopsis dongchuanensis]|uniref:Transposase n=1 Tax=Amycolatopsis dongchuanensis TaxID=1070866 RepID=A0ABP8VGG5_9PSEU